jgi:hypothetical protein
MIESYSVQEIIIYFENRVKKYKHFVSKCADILEHIYAFAERLLNSLRSLGTRQRL